MHMLCLSAARKFQAAFSTRGVRGVDNIGIVPTDATELAAFIRDMVQHLEHDAPVAFRVPALSACADGLTTVHDFLAGADLHSIQHLRVLDGHDSGNVHEHDRDIPPGDDGQRAELRILHE